MPINRTGTPYSGWNYEAKTSTGTSAAGTSSRLLPPQEISENVVSSASATTFVIEYPHAQPPGRPPARLQRRRHNRSSGRPRQARRPELQPRTGRHPLYHQGQLRNRRQAHFVLFPERRHARLRNLRHIGLRLRNRDRKHLLEPGILPSRHREDLLLAKYRDQFSTDEQGSATSAAAYSAAGTTNGDLFTGNNGWVLILPQASSGSLKFCFTTQSGGDTAFTVTIRR